MQVRIAVPQKLFANLVAIPVEEQVSDFSLLHQLENGTLDLMQKMREALLEARDERDVVGIRIGAIHALNTLFKDIPVMRDEFTLLKLNVLESIERESIIGTANALIRSNKWRKALVQRYFGD